MNEQIIEIEPLMNNNPNIGEGRYVVISSICCIIIILGSIFIWKLCY